MSPAPSPEPLTRVNIHLFTADVAILKSHYGPGWQTHAREALHQFVKSLPTKPRTIGDLVNE